MAVLWIRRPPRMHPGCTDPLLRHGVRNLEAKVVAGPKPPLCKNQPLLVGFKRQTRASKGVEAASTFFEPSSNA